MADFTAWVEQNKALWSRVYDEVIQPSLEEEWKKREKRHQDELKDKEKNQELLLEHLNNEILKSARLSKENTQLRDQVQVASNIHGEKKNATPTISRGEHLRLVEENQQLKQQLTKIDMEVASLSSANEAAKDVEPETSEKEPHDLVQKLSELSKKYKDATQQVKYLQRKNATVMQKNKDMKESVRAWQEYADRQSGKRKTKAQSRIEEAALQPSAARGFPDDQPDIPSSPGTLATPRTSPALADLGGSPPAATVPLPHAVETAHQSTTLDPTSGKRGRSAGADIRPEPSRPRGVGKHLQGVPLGIQRVISDHDNQQQPHPSSSQTTVDEHADSMSRYEKIMDDEEDDMPEFVSERSLKRKRAQPSNSAFEIYADRSSDGTPVRPYHVKEEQCSSPPVSAYKLLHHEATMDLDDPAPNLLQTPRRNRRRLSISAAGADTSHQRRCNSEPLTQDIKPEDGVASGAMQNGLQGWTTEAHAPAVVTTTETRALSEPMEPTQAESNVLKSIDPNVVSIASEEPPSKRTRQTEARHRQKHGFLLESGEAPPPLDDKLQLPPNSARAHMNQRLRGLNNPKTPSKPLPKTPQADPTKVKIEEASTPPSSSSRTIHTRAAGKKTSKSAYELRSDPREDPTPDRPIWTMKPPETRSSTRKNRALPSKEQGPLREKPIIELTIQDFKPNPAYNQGYSYAFSETVRKRGDRMCLPGCTNPQCCGSTFRTFAEAQAPLSASQEEALLEDYLGDAYSNVRMTQMSADERKELVIQARTRKMAKESGKHREAYERRRTPPGFWRVDFPTTQEQQEDRERAKEQEKLLIQERWLEAHRKGGKWVFRDE